MDDDQKRAAMFAARAIQEGANEWLVEQLAEAIADAEQRGSDVVRVLPRSHGYACDRCGNDQIPLSDPGALDDVIVAVWEHLDALRYDDSIPADDSVMLGAALSVLTVAMRSMDRAGTCEQSFGERIEDLEDRR